MLLTYKHLKDGRILEKGDEIILHGVEYRVYQSTTRCFLENKQSACNNSKVFQILQKTSEEKYAWARQFNSTGCGDFPEFNNMQDLTDFTKDILEKSPYKEGDIVVVHKLRSDEEETDYPWSFVCEMSNIYGGKQAKIRQITVDTFPCSKKHYNGDPHKYILEDMDGVTIPYTWHSSMFSLKARMKVYDDEPEDDRYDDPDYCTKECYEDESIVISDPHTVVTKIIL